MGSEYGITAETKAEIRLDGIGIFWIVLTVVWTVILLVGMAYLHTKRFMPFLRIRSLSLSFAAVILLHIYWISVQVVYVIAPVAPEEVEFWNMSIYLPFGIALFQASNSEFLHVAKAQKKFARGSMTSVHTVVEMAPRKTLWARFQTLAYTTRMLLYVCAGMVLQLVLTIIVYLASRKFHSDFGVPGTEVHGTVMEQKMQQGRGWEWWPSIFWQFFWAWFIAPIILWQAREIHDTHGWRLQTMACCIAGLHATPMWLIALYAPGMETINTWFLPPQWIALSIMMLETFTILVPCWQVRKHQTLQQETLNTIALWERKNRTGRESATLMSAYSGSTKASDTTSKLGTSCWRSMTSVDKGAGSAEMPWRESNLTMSALEYVLEKDPEPLRQFSALRDFSGENVAFLMSVAEWKASCQTTTTRMTTRTTAAAAAVDPEKAAMEMDGGDGQRERFNRALRIYTDFISPRDAEFEINIVSRDLRKLEAVFEAAARVLYGDRLVPANPAVPFEGVACDSASQTTVGGGSSVAAIGDKAVYWGAIPEGFDETVFDDAENSIKYLVLTNTWPKFVRERSYSMEGRASQDTVVVGSCRSHGSSDSSIARLKSYLRSVKAIS